MSRTPHLRLRTRAALTLLLTAALTAGGPAALAQTARLRVGDQPLKYGEPRAVKQFPLGDSKDNSVLWLRPNFRGKFYLFVENPSAAKKVVLVRLLGPDGATELARSGETAVPARETVPVPLAAPAPRPAPAEGEAKPRPAAPEGLEAEGLPPQLRFQLVEVTREKPTAEEPNPAPKETPVDTVQVAPLRPTLYLKADTPSYDAAKHRLSVAVGAVERGDAAELLAAEPCPVKMTIQFKDAKTGQLNDFVPAKGVFERAVAGADKVALFAEDKGLADYGGREGRITLSADGYERAFRFRITFDTGGGTIVATALDAPDLTLDSPAYGVPGTPLPVRAAVNNVGKLAGSTPALTQLDKEVSIRLRLGRPDGTTFDAYWTKLLPGHRRQRVVLDPRGADGVAYRTEVTDWAVEVPTRGVFGDESFVRAEALSADGEVVSVTTGAGATSKLTRTEKVVMDATPPVIESFGPTATTLVRRGKLRVAARVRDPESGIRRVIFFAGKPSADPKAPDAYLIPEGATRVEGELTAGKKGPGEAGTWEATLADVPTEQKGSVTVSAQVVNGAGLKWFTAVEVQLVDAKTTPPTTGSISGTVSEGMRPQPRLDVVLKDTGGNVKATAKTDDSGNYEFKGIPPGPYVVSAVKGKSATRGETPVEVKAGETTKGANVKLLR